MPSQSTTIAIVCREKDFAVAGINAVEHCIAHSALTGHRDFQNKTASANIYEENYNFNVGKPDSE